MEPQIPVPPPSVDVITPAMYSAIGGFVVWFVTWLGKDGFSAIGKFCGLIGAREKAVAAAAKEGPLMVLEEVKRQLAESERRAREMKEEYTKQIEAILKELSTMRQAHHDCETRYAALQTEVNFLRRELDKLKGTGHGPEN